MNQIEYKDLSYEETSKGSSKSAIKKRRRRRREFLKKKLDSINSYQQASHQERLNVRRRDKWGDRNRDHRTGKTRRPMTRIPTHRNVKISGKVVQ